MSPKDWDTGILVLARNFQFGLIPGHVKIKGNPLMFYSGWTLSKVYPHWSYSPCKILAGSSDSYLLAVVFSHKVNPLNFLAYWRNGILKYTQSVCLQDFFCRIKCVRNPKRAFFQHALVRKCLHFTQYNSWSTSEKQGSCSIVITPLVMQSIVSVC